VRKASHPARPGKPLNGAPQMVEVSRDGKRIYYTNSLYAAWDQQFYPEGIDSWMVKVDVNGAGMTLDPKFFLEFGELRGHQVRLNGGDASSDSYCYP
jgi:selenium-binding protein 1